jgi:pimeloyl-ACP methyl ester carboxylesterase
MRGGPDPARRRGASLAQVALFGISIDDDDGRFAEVGMSEPRRWTRRYVQCASPTGLHRMAYFEWGRRDSPRVLICVHGLTRCARDFDVLAGGLASRYRVICPDVAGRGDSDWLANPMEYQVPQYFNDMVALIARLDVEAVDWLGTSLGGLIGMAMAALPGTPVARLLLNDIGPAVEPAGIARIGGYVGKWPPLATMEAAEAHVREVSAPFGPHTDAEWRFLTEHVVRQNPDGSYRMHYDPAIAVALSAAPPSDAQALWRLYDRVRCPTMVLHGERSDMLARATADEMARRGPRARVAEIAGVGHAPTLIHDDQVQVVRAFLDEA